MSNPDKSPFDHTQDPDLEPPTETLGNDLTRQAEDSKKKKSAKNNVIFVIIGAVVCFAVVKVAMGVMSGPSTPPQAMSQPNMQQAPLNNAPQIDAPQQAQIPMAPPAPILPTVEQPKPASDGVSVSVSQNPLQVPVLGAAPTPPAPVLAVASAPASPASTQGNTTVLLPGQAQPVQVAPVVEAKPAQPAMDTTGLAKQEDLSKLANRVESLENEMKGLSQFDARIKTLEGFHDKDFKAQAKKSSGASTDNASGADVTKVQKPVVKKAYSGNANGSSSKGNSKDQNGNRSGFWLDDGASNNGGNGGSSISKSTQGKGNLKIELEDRGDSLDMSGKSGGGDVQSVNSGNRRAPNVPYQLIAILQDRAWVKMADGTMSTVQVGEFLPNGDKVIKIDPKKDEVRTSAGLLR